MTQTTRTPARTVAIAALLLVLGSLALGACGSSSTTSTAASTATSGSNAATPSTKSKSPQAAVSQAARFRACVRKTGLHVPDTVSSVAELVKHLPKGSSRTRIFEAVQSCAELSPGVAVPKSTTSVTAHKQAFVNFVSCMRAHGVNLPSPNTSGTGPLLDTKGTDTTSAQYKAAIATCSSILRRVLSLPTIKKP